MGWTKKKTFAAMLSLAAALVAAVAACAAEPAPSSIVGKVTNAAGLPLADVIVYVRGSSDFLTVAGNALTGADGSYAISGLPDGTYKVQFDPWLTNYQGGSDHIGAWHSGKGDFASADAVSVSESSGVAGIDARLAQGGSVSGLVTDAAGAPLAYVEIFAHCGSSPDAVSSHAWTDADGQYRVRGLPGGTCKLRFDAGQVNGGSDYVSVWHNGKDSFAAADQVSVAVAGNTPGIDVRLAQGGSVSGRVTDAAGGPLADVDVHVRRSSDAALIGWTRTGGDGGYMVRGLPVGACKVEFDAQWLNNFMGGRYRGEWHSGKDSFAKADPVAVLMSNNTAGINARLRFAADQLPAVYEMLLKRR